jgi:hypothetical protein
MMTDSFTNSDNEIGSPNYHYWIQRYDFSSQEYKNVSAEKAINAFNEFDWDTELSHQNKSDESESCPSGIGIHNGYGEAKPNQSLLHICPIDKNNVFFNLHYPVSKKLLGFIPYVKEEIYYAKNVPKIIIPELIRLFFRKNYREIIKRTSK